MTPQQLLDLLERYGARLATIDGNVTECPLLGATWSIDDEIACAVIESRKATKH